MATTTTQRVSGAVTETSTQRVSAAIIESSTARISATATASNTNRVSAAPTAMTTLRIHHLLLLEGDESGYLLLEGDAQTGTDKLELEGDEASITINVTQRVVTVT